MSCASLRQDLGTRVDIQLHRYFTTKCHVASPQQEQVNRMAPKTNAKTKGPATLSPTAPNASIQELNTYTPADFVSKFLPHHAPTGYLYIPNPPPPRQLASQHESESTDEYIHVLSPAPDLSPEASPTQTTAPPASYVLRFFTSSTIPPSDLHTCLSLITHTSSADYRASSIGWSPARKRAEMQLQDMKYLLWCNLKRPSSPPYTYKVEGFLSFMLTHEDDIPVIYVYEIHVEEKLRGRGVGGMLMAVMEGVGRRAGVEKAMLTVFTRNKAARGWYEGLGWGVDGCSPGMKRLRGGRRKEPEYVILSKALGAGGSGEDGEQEWEDEKTREDGDEDSGGEDEDVKTTARETVLRAPALERGVQVSDPPILINANE